MSSCFKSSYNMWSSFLLVIGTSGYPSGRDWWTDCCAFCACEIVCNMMVCWSWTAIKRSIRFESVWFNDNEEGISISDVDLAGVDLRGVDLPYVEPCGLEKAFSFNVVTNFKVCRRTESLLISSDALNIKIKTQFTLFL